MTAPAASYQLRSVTISYVTNGYQHLQPATARIGHVEEETVIEASQVLLHRHLIARHPPQPFFAADEAALVSVVAQGV